MSAFTLQVVVRVHDACFTSGMHVPETCCCFSCRQGHCSTRPSQSAFYIDYLYHATRVAAEVLGSLKCDCAEQLKLAMEYIQEHDNGIIIYLQQEGRGIGLSNKIAAYSLQVGPLSAHALPLTCPSPLQQRSKPARSCLLMHDAVGHIVQQQSWFVLIVGRT